MGVFMMTQLLSQGIYLTNQICLLRSAPDNVFHRASSHAIAPLRTCRHKDVSIVDDDDSHDYAR